MVRSGSVSEAGEKELDLANLSQFVRHQIAAGTSNLYADYQIVVDRPLLKEVLEHTGGNLTQAAKILGITRTTLRTKLATLGLAMDKEGQAS
jgi:two-component system nitrogen regulation response regulator GlnG